VTFTDTSTGSITNRFWDFGDGGTTNVTTNSVTHTYAGGHYDVALTVTGPGGSSTDTQPNYIGVLTTFENWQTLYFGSTNNPTGDAAADPDGDGFSNLQEFLAGTDPTNSLSSLRIVSIQPQSNGLFITWLTGVGRTNALQATPSGVGSYSNNFTDLFVVTNTVSPTNYLDGGSLTNGPARYYRIRLVP
jgi:PKD repeat protein